MSTLEFTKPRKLSLARKLLIVVVAVVGVAGFHVLAFGSVVLNGTTSLHHNGYFMVRWPLIPVRGSYVSFEAPASVTSEVSSFSFVKRVVGLPGDHVSVEGSTVCVDDICRDLLQHTVEQGVAPIAQGPIPAGHYFVLGDAPDSLDSRYAPIGLIPKSDLQAVGVPIPIPHWKEIHSWFTHE